MNASILKPTQMSLEEFAKVEQKILGSMKDIGDAKDTWQQMHEHFVDAPLDFDLQYQWTFFRLYCDMSWSTLYQHDLEFVTNVLMPRTIPMACMLGIEVVPQLSWYIRTRGVIAEDVETLFLDMKAAFVDSKSIIGTDRGEQKTFGQLVEAAENIDQAGNDTLKLSKMYSQMEDMFFPNEEKAQWGSVIAEPPVEVVRHIMEVISFFRAGTRDNIWYMIDAILYPEKDVVQNIATTPESVPIRPSTKNQLEQKLATMKDASPEAILTYLDEQATKLGKDEIRDVYYFDEKTGTFTLNTDALSDT